MKRIFFLYFALLALRCDLFDSRPAEPPATSSSKFQPATRPDILIQNLMYSFQDKNKQNYIACFSDTIFTGRKFIFSPSGGAIAQFPELAQGWDLDDEASYFDNAVSKVKQGGSISLELFNISSPTPFGNDSIFYSASYRLILPNEDPNLPGEYKGDLTFKMIRDRQGVIWYIYYWQDIKSTDLPSWSELKGRLH